MISLYSKGRAHASGATRPIFATAQYWVASKVVMGRICPLRDWEPLPGQDGVGDVCRCLPRRSLGMWGLWKEVGAAQHLHPQCQLASYWAAPSCVLKGGKKRADGAGTALRWN